MLFYDSVERTHDLYLRMLQYDNIQYMLLFPHRIVLSKTLTIWLNGSEMEPNFCTKTFQTSIEDLLASEYVSINIPETILESEVIDFVEKVTDHILYKFCE